VATNRSESGNPESLGDAEVAREEVVRGDAAPTEDGELGSIEAIRARAYELYLQRGDGGAGDEVNDWLEAEREYHERRGESEAR
jgi:hypothetical protein